MYNILVVDSGAIDREMTRKVLTERVEGSFEVLLSGSSDEAYTVMKERTIDLLIADVPQTAAYIKNFVRSAYGMHKGISVILTSVKSESQIAPLAHKLNAAYLLKPYRGEQLAEIVFPLLQTAREARAKAGAEERSRCLKSIESSIEDCQYKKSIETAKEYIDFLYGLEDNMSVFRMRVVEFASFLAKLGQSRSPELQQKLDTRLERFRLRYDLQSNRFEAASVLEEMLDIIFAEMEQRHLYSDDNLKKVLNYIDRNIKKGVTLGDAAEYVNMSPSHFSKFFKKSAGVNFITYVTDRKIEFAKEMLESTNMPVINIAYELSYNETNYFSKAFKKKVGVTPTEYRESCLIQTGAASGT